MRVEILYKDNSITWHDAKARAAYRQLVIAMDISNVVKVSLMDDRTVLLYSDKREKAK